MRQKFFYFVFLIVLSGMFAKTYAQTVEVMSLNDFSTAEPPKTISVKLIEPLELKNMQIHDSGIILNGDLVDVISPKRLKRDAGFSFKPVTYTDLDGNTQNLDSNIIAKYTKPVDKGGLAKNAALSVGNHFIKGLSMGVTAVKGAVQNEEGNRFKSSAKSVYEASPFSYAEKGEDLYINANQNFFMKFSTTDKNSKKTKDN